jgi:3-oxoacyl-[acyl-carrier-protein] synthase II
MRHTLDESSPIFRYCTHEDDFDFSRWGNGGMDMIQPLGFLKVLPNMLACHVSITHDARGPNNTVMHGELSSLMAIHEAADVIYRGWADVMITGASSARVHPYDMTRFSIGCDLSRSTDAPATVVRPFDVRRSGQVIGEGAASFVLERRSHAEARGANILARLLGFASGCDPPSARGISSGNSDSKKTASNRSALSRCIADALRRAEIAPTAVGHVNADGLGSREADIREAESLNAVLPDVPVTAPKSFFGNSMAGCGAVEMVASLLAFEHGEVPVTLNCEDPDPACPVDVVRGTPRSGRPPVAVLVNRTPQGQAAALVLAGPQ